MRIAFHKLRSNFTRIFFHLLGLKINRWSSEVEFIWNSTETKRYKLLEEVLRSRKQPILKGRQVLNISDIEQAAVMTKQDLREQQLDNDTLGKPKFFRHTAGTTGAPVNLFLDRNELGRMLGVREYCLKHHGLRLGDREARLWGRTPDTLKSYLRDFLLNRRVFYPAGSKAKEEVKSMIEWGPAYVYGYASLVLEAARIVKSNGLQPNNIQCVICTAENILPAQKTFISKALGAPVIEEYGSTEFDVIGFECRNGHLHLVNPWLIVNENQGSCTITDVSRESQSLVRYQLGDALRLKKSECSILGDSVVLEEIEGRSINQFAYVNEKYKFHAVEFAYAVNNYMETFQESLNFSVLQEKYGTFYILAYPPPKQGIEHLACYVEQEIDSRILAKINVEPMSESMEPSLIKRGYFIQKLSFS